MVRRTVLAIVVLCGALAGAVLAFASEISRAGSHLVERAVWRRRAFTAVTASATSVQGDGRLVTVPEPPRGEYCRFPPSRGSEAATAIPGDSVLGNSIGSTPLPLEGQSRIPAALPPALCAGDTVAVPPVPGLGKP